MKRNIKAVILAAIVAMASYASAQAQFGFGAGLAAAGDNISQAQGELSDLFNKQNISAGDISGNLGFYAQGRVRIDLAPINLIGDVSYIYFPSKEITLTQGTVNPSDSTGSARFDVGTSMIPIAAGATFALPLPVLKPYVGAQLCYTYIKRTYTFVSGGSQFQSLQIENTDASDPEVGMTLNAGVEFDLAVLTLDVGARYNMTNLFTTSGSEKPMRHLQIGASLFF
ncbi:MAG TPA: outer membrane beta-barrel protein [Candidatus Kapabacteria bacterium]|nr:outer membrane beta-barrel protein [Candidatus Kapabacteria bacterium]